MEGVSVALVTPFSQTSLADSCTMQPHKQEQTSATDPAQHERTAVSIVFCEHILKDHILVGNANHVLRLSAHLGKRRSMGSR
jgi:hypothetical protein